MEGIRCDQPSGTYRRRGKLDRLGPGRLTMGCQSEGADFELCDLN